MLLGAQDTKPRLSAGSMGELTWKMRWDEGPDGGGILDNIVIVKLSLSAESIGEAAKPALTFFAGSGFQQRKIQAVQVPCDALGKLVPYLVGVIHSDIRSLAASGEILQLSINGRSYVDPTDPYLFAENMKSQRIATDLLSKPRLGEQSAVVFRVGEQNVGARTRIEWPVRLVIGDQGRKLNMDNAKSLLTFLVKAVHLLRDAGFSDSELGVHKS